jgi:2-polyprenyl-3-methyl-5-hydroxy-6-metoxy-1,4-benzoquinol methylase
VSRAGAAVRCLCGGERLAPVFAYDAPPPGEVRFRFSATGAYAREVRRCEGCGHFLSLHAMDDSALYRDDYVSTTYGGEGLRAAFERIVALPPERSDNAGRVQRILAFAADHLPAPARDGRAPTVLDVGSGLCVFLHRMRAAGWVGTALDKDPRQVAHARDVVGVAAVCGDLLTADGLGRYDVVTFNKVLEHVRDPVRLLAASRRVLHPQGFVYVELPDGEAAVHEGPGREEFFIEHHHVFSAASVEVLAARAGFRALAVERLREPSRKFTLRAFLAPAAPAGSPEARGMAVDAAPIAWTRRTRLGGPAAGQEAELWEAAAGPGPGWAFPVEVTVGKPFDVLALKGGALADVRRYARFLAETAARLYGRGRTAAQAACPCCGGPAAADTPAAVIFGVAYRRCGRCGHAFVGAQPDPAVLAEVFAESEEHAGTYTDPAQVELRLAQIVRPKLAWVRETYRRQYGQEARAMLDVGAGGGHFVALCRREGLAAEGYEISRVSRRFAREAFGLDLRDGDFLAEAPGGVPCDVVTLWGLLEYTPEPVPFLEAARRRLGAGRGMVVVEVPRFDCLGTAIQVECPDTVARHLDPTSHVNCFSDASLATALVRAGLRPVAAWYFGMDAYELLVQVALRLEDGPSLERLAPWIPRLQAWLDAARLCDDVVVAAVPLDAVKEESA